MLGIILATDGATATVLYCRDGEIDTFAGVTTDLPEGEFVQVYAGGAVRRTESLLTKDDRHQFATAERLLSAQSECYRTQ